VGAAAHTSNPAPSKKSTKKKHAAAPTASPLVAAFPATTTGAGLSSLPVHAPTLPPLTIFFLSI
jgi:hypothetical protein